MKKTFLVLIVLLALSFISVHATEGDIGIIKPVGEASESGYQEYGVFDLNGNEVIPDERDSGIALFSRLPEKYDSRDYGYISPVRNQGAFGTCWAHAFIACAEANMIKKGYELGFNNYSEAHLAYFYHKRNEAQGDGADVFNSQSGFFGGGNGVYAAQFAENFQALAVESDFPYSMTSNSSDFRIDEKFRNHSDVHMVGFGKIKDSDDAKKAIMEYGAISVSYCDRDGYLSGNAAYYQPVNYQTNHEVTVVGWDDNFPVEKFNSSCRPQNPGAWLVKNSWGLTYGDFGYFWISYEEPSLILGCFYDFEPISNENKVHTYNGGISTLVWEISKAANVFQAKENQTVYSVGFDAATYRRAPEKYEINIYVSDSRPSNPEAGTKKLTQTGTLGREGFYRIELNTPIKLKAGQYLSVVVSLKNNSNQPSASLFEAGNNFSSRQYESWAYSGSWKNMHNFSYSGFIIQNSTIKAYYKTDTATVTFNTREREHFDTVTVNVGECVSRPSDPVKEGYEFLGWYTNNTVTDEWDFSTPVTHDMVLFAKWSEPKNVDMKVRSKYFSPNYNPGITLSAENIKDYTFYFTKDGKYHTYTATFDSSYLNQWRYWNIGSGNFGAFATVRGINGEEITTETEPFTVTSKTALSVQEGFITIVNIPPNGVDLYMAQYDATGRFIGAEKRTYYRSYASNGVDIINYKSITAPTNKQNPQYFLWAAGETTPLAEAE